MVESRLRARFVQNGVGCLYIIYPRRSDLALITSTAKNFSRRTGATVKVVLLRLDDERKKSPVIEVQQPLTSNALRILKELTSPDLPIAIATVTLRLLLCKCDFLSTQHPPMLFVAGFEPDDPEAFRLHYLAAFQQLPLGDLLPAAPGESFEPLMDAIEKLLRNLGARATALNIESKIDTRPCVHP